jgi:hypothetical protein
VDELYKKARELSRVDYFKRGPHKMVWFGGGTAALGSTCDIVEMKNLTDYISLFKGQYRPRQSSERISVENI